MTQNLKIEVVTENISESGVVVTSLVTKEELSQVATKKADLGADGKIPTSQLPDNILNTTTIVDQVKTQLESTIQDGIQEANSYAESYVDDAVVKKADLGDDGKVPKEQLPPLSEYTEFKTSNDSIKNELTTAFKKRTDQLELSKASLDDNGKVLREQLPEFDELPGVPELLEDLSTKTVKNIEHVIDQAVVEATVKSNAVAADAAARAEAAAVASNIGSKVYNTPSDGVKAGTGVPVSSYFNVRSPRSEYYVDEYLNRNGVPEATGKSYPSAKGLQDALTTTGLNVARSEAAATAAAIGGKVYATAAAGVDPVTGVPVGDYFNVRSSSDESYVDEYQNLNGNAVATGKRYLSALGVQVQEKAASTIKDASGKWQQDLNDVTKSLYNYINTPTPDTESVQLSVLDYLQSLPLNPSPVHSPKGFANGGEFRIPRGRYLITEPIKIKRGIRIVGESHESTQIISRSLTGVFVYEDDGGYVPDEIVAENISVWQDPEYVPTSGAAFQVQEGEYTTAIQFKFNNVLVEGTYKGVEAISGIGCTVSGITVTKCISHGIDINNKGESAKSTTSATLLNCYTFLNGGNGVNIRGSSYISILGGASDSNAGYGYAADTANTLFLNGGAERNALGNAYFKDLASGNVQLHSVQHDGAGHGIVLNNSSGLNLIGSGLYRSGTNVGNGIYFEANPKIVTAIGLTNVGYTKETLTNNYAYINFHVLTGSLSGGVVKGGATNNWQYGNTLSLDLTSQVSVVGLTEATTRYGLKVSPSFTTADAIYNTAGFAQFITATSATTTNYALAVGHYVDNAFLGTNTTVSRTAGQYIKEQTRGSTSNANLMIDGGQGTVPAGNWSIYNGSSRANYYGGPLTWKPSSVASPVNSGDMTFELTSNTELKIKVRGSDGVLRSASITLA